jgi:UDP-N-acetylglucosamine--N-acetylmuramyl-(pentapeptide) pyrophosphoryl-undecaprenol N-acetylglucosamine transferase
MEEDVTDTSLLDAINEIYDNRDNYIKAMELSTKTDSITLITDMIDELAG